MTRQVGEDIRSLRRTRGLTLVELAGAVNRSVGWLSQVERGRTTPSVDDLGAVAARLGVSISFFFRSSGRAAEERGVILRAADRMTIGTQESGLVEELLSPSLGGSFEMIRSAFAPHSSSADARPAAGREDGGVLIAGRLLLTIGGRDFELAPGDSFQFAGKSYSWRNPGEETAIVIWVVSPPVY